MKTESGKQITRSDFGGKLLVLNFWATWCPPCIEEMPSLDQFAREMSNSGVVVLGVSIDTNENAYKHFVQQARPTLRRRAIRRTNRRRLRDVQVAGDLRDQPRWKGGLKVHRSARTGRSEARGRHQRIL